MDGSKRKKVKKPTIKVDPPPPPLEGPDDWPIQTDNPFDASLTQPSLPPGPALASVSGADIHLAKSATVTNKNRPQYLALLPGILSVTAENSKLARLEGASSSTPKLVVPTLGTQRLELSGTRVHTSSKYLVLTLQPKKKRVICKNVFSSVLVFGNAKLDGKAAAATASSTEETAAVVPTELRHFGASSRAAGGKAVSPSGSVRASSAVTQESLPVESSGDEGQDDDSAVSEDEYKIAIDRHSLESRSSSRRVARQRVSYTQDDDDDDDESSDESAPLFASKKKEEEEEDKKPAAKMKTSISDTKPAAKKPKKTARPSQPESDDEEEEFVDDDASFDGEEVVPASKPRACRARRRSAPVLEVDDSSSEEEKAAKPAETSTIELLERDDNTGLATSEAAADAAVSKKRPPCKAAAKGPVIELDGEDDDSYKEESDEDDGEEQAAKPSSRKRTARASSSKQPLIELEDSEDEEVYSVKPTQLPSKTASTKKQVEPVGKPRTAPQAKEAAPTGKKRTSTSGSSASTTRKRKDAPNSTSSKGMDENATDKKSNAMNSAAPASEKSRAKSIVNPSTTKKKRSLGGTSVLESFCSASPPSATSTPSKASSAKRRRLKESARDALKNGSILGFGADDDFRLL